MPVTFKKCQVFPDDDILIEEFEQAINALNNQFVFRSCLCHPNKNWVFAVDYTESLKYKIHFEYLSSSPCEFGKKILLEATGVLDDL